MKTLPGLLILLVSAAALISCSSGEGGSGDGGGAVPSGQVRLTGTVQPDPASPTSATGQQAGAKVYIIGQQDSVATTDSNGNFTLTANVTLSATVLSGPKRYTASVSSAQGELEQYDLVVISAENTHGKKTEVRVTGGQSISLDTIYINTVGQISGKARLQGQTDHTGIRVYIPGTSFQATTDANGNYSMSGVPSGSYAIVRADYPGTVYNYAAVAKVTVGTNEDTILPDMLLQLSFGPNGSVLINNGNTHTTSKTVDVSIAPSANAVLMMISGDINFQGVSWEPVAATKQYTFPGNFDDGAVATIYIRFSDISGLESTPVSDAIFIDTNPLATELSPLDSGVIADTKPAFSWKYAPVAQLPNPRYRIQLTAAADTSFASPLADATTDALVTQYTYTAAPLGNLSNYIWRVAIIDEADIQWNWAGPWAFEVDLQTVTLTSPANLSYSNKAANDAGITFTWQSNPSAASYILSVCYNDPSAGCAETHTVSAPQTSKTIPTLTAGEGDYYWAVTPKDVNGITGTKSAIYSFTLDTVAPTGSAAINGNDTFTNATNVTLRLTASDSKKTGSYYIVESSTLPSAPLPADAGWISVTEPAVSLSADAGLSLTGSPGTKNIYVWYKDVAGNVSLPGNCSIELISVPLTTIDNNTGNSLDASIGTDSNNNVYISYHVDAGGMDDVLKLAVNGTGSWVTSVQASSIQGAGTMNALAAGPTTTAHMIYLDGNAAGIKYITSPASPLNGTLIDHSGCMWQPALVQRSETLYASYHCNAIGDKRLKFAKFAGSWSNETIDTTGEHGSPAVDTAGTVHVAYYDSSAQAIKYAKKATSDVSWTIVTVVSNMGSMSGAVARYISLGIDSSDNLHLTYVDLDNGKLMYTINASGAWGLPVIIDEEIWSGNVALAVDSGGKMHISYFGPFADLKYATNSSGVWKKGIIDGSGNVGQVSAIAVDFTGRVHFSYVDNTNRSLKYATW